MLQAFLWVIVSSKSSTYTMTIAILPPDLDIKNSVWQSFVITVLANLSNQAQVDYFKP